MSKKRNTKGTPDPIDIHVGKRLKLRRSLLGLSQEKLADSVALTFQQIQKYEKGTNRISAGRLFEFSKILEVPVSYFYEQIASNKKTNAGFAENAQEGFNAGPSNDFTQNKETFDLLRAYYAIKDKGTRKDLLKLIKSMAKS